VERLAGSEIAEDIARMLLTAAWTGMRRGELLALHWEDYVDQELRVERSVWRRQEKSTKTADPRRITVVPPLAQVLSAQRRWLIATQHPGLSSGLVFPASPLHAKAGAKRRGADEVSWYRSPTIFAGPMKKVVQAAKITDISAHSLRRTWENLLREAGVDQLVRRALAGWRTEKAQAIYATVAKGEREAAGEAIVSLVMGEGT
jgi:integrase